MLYGYFEFMTAYEERLENSLHTDENVGLKTQGFVVEKSMKACCPQHLLDGTHDVTQHEAGD
jgi:hypothetical protein